MNFFETGQEQLPGSAQGVLNDDGGEGFQGALVHVELGLEIYDSLVCTYNHHQI